MIIGKQKYLTMQRQLEEAGVETTWLKKQLAVLEKKITYNRNQDVHPRINRYLKSFADQDAQQCISRYRWEGLPPGVTSWQIESMLYYRGSLAGFIRGGTLFVLPWVNSGAINIYGMPTKIQPITYNGVQPQKDGNKFGIPLTVDKYGKADGKGGAVLLYDRIPFTSGGQGCVGYSILNRQFVELEADIMGRIENNLDAACMKLVFECETEDQKNQLAKDITENLAAGRPYVIVKKNTLSNRDGSTYQNPDIKLDTQNLIECLQSVNSLRCAMPGIRNGGVFEKKERVIQSELSSDSIQADMVIDTGLFMRQYWIEGMKQQYPNYLEMLNKIRPVMNTPTEQAQEAQDPVTEVKTSGGEEIKYD